MVSALITVAVIAWCAQLALGGWQISRFNRAFDTLCQPVSYTHLTLPTKA